MVARSVQRRRFSAVVLAFLAWRVTAGPVPATISQSHAAVYEQADLEFARAAFFKPAEADSADLPFRLAPLLLQESTQTKGLPLLERLGTPILSNGVLAIDSTRPAVFVEVDSVRLNGKPHARFSYSWFYPPMAVQGVRLTLSTAGQPAIWEVLANAAAPQLLFVSDSLESAAKAQFGPPLPGRRYSAECALVDAPNVVVARVLADSGVPMGPMVYLRAGTHEVATVSCRCMPVQTKALVMSCNYSLVPVNSEAQHSPLLLAEQQNRTRMTYRPGQEDSDPRVAKCLRLPRGF